MKPGPVMDRFCECSDRIVMANRAKLHHFSYCGNAWSTKGRELPAPSCSMPTGKRFNDVYALVRSRPLFRRAVQSSFGLAHPVEMGKDTAAVGGRRKSK
jgi:hypothetical protein